MTPRTTERTMTWILSGASRLSHCADQHQCTSHIKRSMCIEDLALVGANECIEAIFLSHWSTSTESPSRNGESFHP